MIRDGEGIVAIAKILDHSIETAHRYSQPTEHSEQRATEPLTIDEYPRTIRAGTTTAPSRTTPRGQM
jgi:hypothetical protein